MHIVMLNAIVPYGCVCYMHVCVYTVKLLIYIYII